MLKFTCTVDPSSSALALLSTMQDKTSSIYQLLNNVSMRMHAAVLKNFDAGGRPSWPARKRDPGWKLLWHSGRLIGSIHPRVQADAAEVFSNSSDVIYAAAHQFGTPARTIVPKKGKYLKFTIGDKTIFAKSVNWPGLPARPFMSMLPAEEDEIKDMIFDWVEGTSGGSAFL